MYSQERMTRLEQELRKNPKAYHRKVKILAWLGNLYIAFGVVLLVVLLILACLSILVLKAFAIKIIIPVAIFLYVIVKSLWISVEKPQGISIQAKDAPELFKIIDELSLKLNSPSFHHVLITDDFNAAVVQTPRLGLFGWYENYLIIGLPLMQSLSVAQLTSVLAHEFGHLSKNHGKTANWIYRQRIRWAQLYQLVEQNASRIDIIFRPFFKRFVPYFASFSFPVARADEYEADKISVQLTSAETVAQTLTTVNVVGCYLSEEFWPAIFKHAENMPKPIISPYLGYVNQLIEFSEPNKTKKWLDQSLKLQTSLEDTHPSLMDRLEAIGQTAQLVFAEKGHTADLLLGDQLAKITATFDHQWQNNVLGVWQQHHQHIQQQKEYLKQLNEKLARGEKLSTEERFTHVELTDTVLHQPDIAFDLMRELYEEDQENALANYIYGRLLLERKDQSGCAILERSAQMNEFYQVQVYEMLYQFYLAQDFAAEAEKYQRRMLDRVELEQMAMSERQEVSFRDHFIPHGLTLEELEDLLQQLRKYTGIQQVWLVQKQVQHLKHIPCYILGFSLKKGFNKVDIETIVQTAKVLQENVVFPGETFLLCFDVDENQKIKKNVRQVQSAQII
ncbi:M48 family metalloprotease [Acinetobacter sp.]|uniref:M48 family metalloprotease n=1 Tax=Acinetobacter sp. TaxID=472 RepID=UPI00333F61CA